jgi:hypothetical protein
MILRSVRERCLAGPVTLLGMVLLIPLQAVAFAVPPEPLHLAGIQNGADYDSLIQPLVCSLAGLPVEDGRALAPVGPSRSLTGASIPDRLLVSVAHLPPPRAPPLD